ncbi:MAG TPA: hypothetical protein VML55_10335 [Planctomycetaceae bacterium]|nr:hypothetical protein [Planctomycetaceae bacterium]
MTATSLSPAIVRRLMAAEGYLELGLPAYALRELDAVADPGPLTPHALYLRGRTFIAQSRYEDAIEPLKQAAPRRPAPHNRVAWLSLGRCYRCSGQESLAEIAETLAKSPPEPPSSPMTIVEITVLVPRALTETSQ